jgi:fatty-acyl-CoA synthase
MPPFGNDPGTPPDRGGIGHGVIRMKWIDDIKRETRTLGVLMRAGWGLRHARPGSRRTTADIVERWADETPSRTALCFEGREFSYAEYDAWGNRYAHWARAQGIRQGDVVAILMENRPQFLFAWLGLAKLGAVSALINSNLRGAPLVHSLKVAGARHLILGGELEEAFRAIEDQLDEPPRAWVTREAESEPGNLDPELMRAPSTRIDPSPRAGLTAGQTCFYVYTSGTTGNPKAARISHYRFAVLSNGFAAVAELEQGDRMGVVLPLYHTAGGLCAVGSSLAAGTTIALFRRFSASRFWRDCREQRVTCVQYIGELCRYLLNSPPDPDERAHGIRLMLGNGLRPEVWRPFQERFGIPRIVEFYGATESNVGMINIEGKVGAMGRIPPLLEPALGIRLVRYDVESDEVVRDANGLCVAAGIGEPGEALGRVAKAGGKPTSRFEGYSSAEETEKKILHDVVEKGDRWFRTGDLMRKDEQGYYYFVDRIGDTFRWKGENVSTTEVAEVISRHPGVKEANVYGVEIPGHDGRAGMAALVVDPSFDLDDFHRYLEPQLADYAAPRFLRLQERFETTATFKHRKVDLTREGFDPSRISDPLYFASREKPSYVPLDPELHERIVTGKVRV